MKRVITLATFGIALFFSFAACDKSAPANVPDSAKAVESAKKTIKVALILPGSISDASWNAGAYNGLVWLKEHRDDVETAYVEEISNEKAEATLTIYAKEGYDIIFAFGSEFTANIIKVAQQYPNVYFANTDQTRGLNLPANVSTFAGDERAASFLVGALAGYLSRTDVVGTVEGFESPDLSSNTVHYFAGYKYVKPNGRTLNSYVGSWSDVEKAKQTALAQIEAGVGFIYASGDAIGLGIIEASKEKSIPVVGYGTDLNELAPKNIITSVIWNVGITFNAIVEDIKNGRFSNSIYYQGLEEGAIVLADYHGTVDSQTAAKIEEIKQKLSKGEIPLN
ncbi:MAG: BMP family protein [Treponema sp.]|jgi:basic membrane protein A|nr:BMP family protein [Treponema sp.]